MNSILSYDESGYNGKYEYKSRDEYPQEPEGEGWYLTQHGWARGSNAKDGGTHIPTKIIKNPQDVILNSQHCCKIARSSRDINAFVASGITNCFSASNIVIEQKEDHRNNYRKFDDMIVGFADAKKPQYAPSLSTIMAMIFHLSLDFRCKNKSISNFDEDFIESVKKYIANEQEIIRMTGLLNDDDTITLFRNTDATQLYGNSQIGLFSKYKGNNFESWSTNPGLKFADSSTPKVKVMAKVPLYACIASCIGRKERPFMFKDRGECEIMACGAFVQNATIVGDLSGIRIENFRDEYLSKCQSNMKVFSNQLNQENSRITSNVLAERFARITRNILSNLFR